MSIEINEYEIRDSQHDDSEFSDSIGGYNRYVEKCKEQAFASDFVSDIVLAGHSSNGKESCQQWKLVGCLEGDLHNSKMIHAKKTRMSCNSKGCNKCFDSAIKREAHAINNRMFTFCNLKNNRKIYLKENRSRILSHVVVSMPLDQHYKSLTPDGRKELKNTQRKIMKSLDVDGGCTIFHPYRFTKGLEHARLSPHFHNIITGWIDGGIVKEIYNQTGWIVKQISTLETEHECYSLSAYLLSHAGIYERKAGNRSSEHSVSYFGECQNRKFKVVDILSKSATSREQIDRILYSKKEKTIKGIDYKLQKVHYTNTTISGSVKDSINEYRVLNGDMPTLTKTMREYIRPHIDNPALSQSEPKKEPFHFLQMRFDYGESPTACIVQSEYITIILDPSLDELCPECSFKLRTLVPKEWSKEQQDHFKNVIFLNLKEDELISMEDDCGLQYLSRETLTGLGMPYFKLNGDFDMETGIYSRPECLDRLNPTLRTRITKNIDLQKFKYQYKIENGLSPNRQEVSEFLKPVITRKTNSHKISDF